MRRIGALLSAAVAAAVLGGCGGGASQTAQVRATLAQFSTAITLKDYKTICNRLLAPNLVAELTQINLPCTTALSRGLDRVIEPTLTVETVKVTGQSALATVDTGAANQPPDDTTVGLVEVGSSWRIASLPQTTAPSK